MTCNPCGGTGFKNIDERTYEMEIEDTLSWIAANKDETDMTPCDCCGDGTEWGWYGEPGQHYGASDPQGKCGPYAYNGGLCECH